MVSVNVAEAKARFSEYLDRVEHGEEVIVTRRGKPVARLVPEMPGKEGFPLGIFKGRIRLSPGWDDPMTETDLLGI